MVLQELRRGGQLYSGWLPVRSTMENFCGESPANRKRSELPEGSRRYGRRQRTPNAALLPDISTAL